MIFDTRSQALILSGNTLSVVGQWFIDNAEELEHLITPEFKETILSFEVIAKELEKALLA